jgi:hypothetical protein
MLFRPRAIRSQVETRLQVVPPPQLHAPALSYLWVLLGLLTVAAVWLAAAEIPKFTQGIAVLSSEGPASGSTHLDILLPGEHVADVAVGSRVYVDVSQTRSISGSVSRIEPSTIDAQAVAARFGLELLGAAAESWTLIEAVVLLPDTPSPAGSEAPLAVAPARVVIGSRRLISLLSFKPAGSAG